jgi:hypothetical protein
MKIEKGVTMPPPQTKPRSKESFAKVEAMDVGDSVLHPYDEFDFTLHARLKASALRYGKRNGQAFDTRNMPDGIRIWRTA